MKEYKVKTITEYVFVLKSSETKRKKICLFIEIYDLDMSYVLHIFPECNYIITT